MEWCVGVSTETVLQIDKFYTVVKIILKLTFWTVVLRHSDEGLETLVLKLFSLRWKT